MRVFSRGNYYLLIVISGYVGLIGYLSFIEWWLHLRHHDLRLLLMLFSGVSGLITVYVMVYWQLRRYHDLIHFFRSIRLARTRVHFHELLVQVRQLWLCSVNLIGSLLAPRHLVLLVGRLPGGKKRPQRRRMARAVISLALTTLIIDVELDILAADILRHNLVALLRA